MLRREPVGVVFGEGSLVNGDDLLEQRHSLFDLAVGLVGYDEVFHDRACFLRARLGW